MPDNFHQLIKSKIFTIENESSAYRPQLFRVNEEDDKQKFQELLSQNESLQLHDNIVDQLTELIKIIHVSQKINAEDISGLISAYLNTTNAYEYGVWAYYPWLNKAIHILDEEEFIKVRTNRNQHKITESELQVLRKKKIGVIGLSVGQCIASTLILERCCGEIRLADFDDIQLSNLNRINTSLANIGLLKIIQIAREISEIDPYIKVVCYKEGITENNIENFLLEDGKLDILVEECDSIDIKILARVKAKEHRIAVVMDTNDRGMVDIERYDINDDYPLLHGLLGDISYKNFKNLPLEQTLPVFLKFFAFDNVSPRGKVTLVELGQSLSTWPQIASSVVLGGALVTDITRRILLDHLKISGRFYVDTEDLIKENSIPIYTPPDIEELQPLELVKIADDFKDENVIDVSKTFIENIVTDAGTAPSSGNDQPWKFLFKNKSLYLFHEAARSYSFGDYRNMASYISLGSAIENTVLSAHNYGNEISVQLFPKSNDLKFIAKMNFKTVQDSTVETHEVDELYNQINLRCTNRKVQPNEPADESTLQQLKAVTESIAGAKVSFLTDKKDLQNIGAVISECDRIRIMNPRAHYEFFNREIRWNENELEKSGTGMGADTLELAPPAMLALKTIGDEKVMNILRAINGLQAFKNVSVPNAVNASAIGLVTMPSFTPTDFVNGGRAVERQWLKATELGFAYHPMLIPLYLFYRTIYGKGEGLSDNIITELNGLRKKFMQLFPGDEMRGEVFLFRIFKADAIKKRALRLPLSKILQIETTG